MAKKKRILDQIRAERDAPVKKRGRPKGSTNKKKEAVITDSRSDDPLPSLRKYVKPVSDTTYYIYETKGRKFRELVTYTIYKDGLENLLDQLQKHAGKSKFEVVAIRMKDDPALTGFFKNA